MADPHDPNPALRAEIDEAITVITPKIHGLQEIIAISGTATPLTKAMIVQLDANQLRYNRMAAVIAALDAVIAARIALEATGYPTVGPVVLQRPLIDELRAERDDLLAAISIFEDEPIAATLAVDLGEPREK